jgi:glucan biosynthesis protein C
MHLWFLYDLIYVTAACTAVVALMSRLGLAWPRVLAWVRRTVECPWRFIVVVGGLNLIWCAFYEWTGIPTEGAWVPEEIQIIVYYLLWYGLGWMIFASETVLSKFEDRAWTLMGIGAVCVAVRSMVRRLLNDAEAPSEALSTMDGASSEATVGLFDQVGEMMMSVAPADSDLWTYGGVFWSSLGLVVLTRGLMGLFLRYAGSGKPFWRYVSDSSYWVYLIHLPVAMFIPALMAPWPLPVMIKFPLSVILVGSFCWLTYDCAIRPTLVGRFLNGRRYPARAPRLSAAGSVLFLGAMGYAAVTYPPPLERPGPWHRGESPVDLLAGEAVVYPLKPTRPPPEGVQTARCLQVQRYVLCPDRVKLQDVPAACAAFGASDAILETEAEHRSFSLWPSA